MANASLVVRKLIVTPEGGKPFLIVEVEIKGPAAVSFQLHGQYLASVTGQFAAIQAEHPELCGVPGVQKDQVDWAGRVAPGKETLN